MEWICLLVVIYLLPICISIHLIKEFKLYVNDAIPLFIPFFNIAETMLLAADAVKEISKEARKGKNND